MMFLLSILIFLAVGPLRKIILVFLMIQSGVCNVLSPKSPFICHVGEEALFNYTTSDGRTIFSVNWGIKNGNHHPDSQFINTNVYTKVVNYNRNMDPKCRDRVFFVGNLTMGRAWFVLKNVTFYDEKKYVANIHESEGGILAYVVQLKVKKRVNPEPTTRMPSTPATETLPTSSNITVKTDKADKCSIANGSLATTSDSPNKAGTKYYYWLLAVFVTTLATWIFLTFLFLVLRHYKKKTRIKKDKHIDCSEPIL